MNQVGFGDWFVRRGRITRRTWWLHYTLPIIGLGLLAGIADTALGYPGLNQLPEDAGTFWATTGGPLGTLVCLFSIVPTVSAGVTRLHDRDHSAWWLLWCLVPLVGAIILFVQQACLQGWPTPNRYGPPVPPGQSGTPPWL